MLLLSYFILCLGRTAADCPTVENHGGRIMMYCDAMIFAAAQAFFWSETGKNSICPGFNLRVPPRVGANRHVCITAFSCGVNI